MNRRGFFRSILGVLVGTLLPKTLQGNVADVVLLPYVEPMNPIGGYYKTTGKFIWPMKKWKGITIIGGGGGGKEKPGPGGGGFPGRAVLKEGSSKSRGHGTNYRAWVRWPVDKVCKVTVGDGTRIEDKIVEVNKE